MRICIISNLTNGAGLERDYRMLRGLLESWGHEVHGQHWRGARTAPDCDVTIFEEVVPDQFLGISPVNWLTPHPEWWYPASWDRFLPRFDKVLCKTRDALRIFHAKVGNRAVFTGWEANDFHMPEVVKKRVFLHLARTSPNKGTDFLMEAWRKHSIPYPLIAVAKRPEVAALCRGVPNVTHVEDMDDAELRRCMNECAFYAAPTMYEGYGLAINEAIGCGAVVITTDAAPMNEFPAALFVPVAKVKPRLAAQWNMVDVDALAEMVHLAWAMSDETIAAVGRRGRAGFLAGREYFRETLRTLLDAVESGKGTTNGSTLHAAEQPA